MGVPREKAWRVALALVAAGTAARVVLAFAAYGNQADIDNTATVYAALRDGSPFDLYPQVDADGPVWPYAPGFLPWVLVAGVLGGRFGHFDGWLQLAPVAADAGIALLLFAALRDRRAGLAAVALVAFGPVFVLISGYAFQIDSVAVLPALAAVLLWDRGGARRALAAGALVGAAAAVKPPLALVLLALLPTARSPREALTAAAAAAAVPLALLAPFLAADARGTVEALTGYAGLAGQGGLTALVQPDMTDLWLRTRDFGAYENALEPLAPLLLAAVAAATLLAGRRLRPRAVELALLLFLLVWAFGPGFSFAYLIWGLPFALVTGRVRLALALQALALGPLLALITVPHPPAVVALYRADVIALWLLTVAAAGVLVRDLAGGRAVFAARAILPRT